MEDKFMELSNNLYDELVIVPNLHREVKGYMEDKFMELSNNLYDELKGYMEDKFMELSNNLYDELVSAKPPTGRSLMLYINVLCCRKKDYMEDKFMELSNNLYDELVAVFKLHRWKDYMEDKFMELSNNLKGYVKISSWSYLTICADELVTVPNLRGSGSLTSCCSFVAKGYMEDKFMELSNNLYDDLVCTKPPREVVIDVISNVLCCRKVIWKISSWSYLTICYMEDKFMELSNNLYDELVAVPNLHREVKGYMEDKFMELSNNLYDELVAVPNLHGELKGYMEDKFMELSNNLYDELVIVANLRGEVVIDVIS
ncbi:unnamed protein product [Mytilus edulis]|uniref:Uncharacterized protein n=1 Tax=Mytilus edulis TaxID=6550 RepID=A0A8S3S8U2_MYTED|nr:unnamed protein product [Mytilus edulis]